MVLEVATTKAVNIRDLTIPEPVVHGDAFFDPERDIDRELWGKLVGHVETFRNNNVSAMPMGVLAQYASYLSILSPGRKGERGLTDEDRAKVEQEHKTRTVRPGLAVARALKQLWPERDYRDLYFEDEKQELLSELRNTYMGRTDRKIEIALTLLMIDPDFVRENIVFDDGLLEKMKIIIHDFKINRSDWDKAFEQMAFLKILYPDRANGFLDPQLLERAKGKISEHLLLANFSGYVADATGLYIMAADKVEVTDRGIQVTLYEQPEIEEQLPEIKETQ